MRTTSIPEVIDRIYTDQVKSTLLKNHKCFAAFFFPVLKSTLNLPWSEKKKKPHRSSISEVIESERCAYLNAWENFFLKTIWQ